MDNISLDPFAARIELGRTNKSGAFSVEEAVIFLTERLAVLCSGEKNAVIGHIKGFCTTPSGAWVKVSVIDPGRPADREGRLNDDADRGEFILNAHVLGMRAHRINELLTASARDLEAKGFVSTTWRRPEDHQHGHGHDHQDHTHCL